LIETGLQFAGVKNSDILSVSESRYLFCLAAAISFSQHVTQTAALPQRITSVYQPSSAKKSQKNVSMVN